MCMMHPELPRAEAWAIGVGIVALFQVIPVSPGSLCRGCTSCSLVDKRAKFQGLQYRRVSGLFQIHRLSGVSDSNDVSLPGSGEIYGGPLGNRNSAHRAGVRREGGVAGAVGILLVLQLAFDDSQAYGPSCRNPLGVSDSLLACGWLCHRCGCGVCCRI